METHHDLPLFAARPVLSVIAGALADMDASAPASDLIDTSRPDNKQTFTAAAAPLKADNAVLDVPVSTGAKKSARPLADRPVSLAQALAEVRNSGALEGNALRQVASDFSMVAKTTGVLLEDLPCDPRTLRPILKKVAPARRHMTMARWSTIRSSLARVLKIVGWVDDEGGRGQGVPLTGQWEAAAEFLPVHGQKAALRGFARFCIGLDILPAAVTLETILNYQTWRVERTISLDINHVASITRRMWRYLQAHHVGWPQDAIPAARDARRYALPLTAFPEEFQAAVETLMRNMEKITPLDPRFVKKYSMATIGNTRASLVRAATIIADGVGGAEFVRCLHDVLSPAAIHAVLEDHFTRVGNDLDWAPSAKTMAYALARCARMCGEIDQAEMESIFTKVKLVKTPSAELSQKSRSRVTQFHDPAVMHALVNLPAKLFADGERYRKAGCMGRAACLYERGLQLAILLVHPMRRKNLACLKVNEHFHRDRDGKIHRLSISGAETKSGKAIDWKVPKDLADRIDHYLKLYQPPIAGGSSPYMWPGGQGGHKALETVARNLKEVVEGDLGVTFSVHVVRHLVATLLLEDDPNNGPLAQQMLGHRDLKTTQRIYGHARQDGAQQAWGKTLETRAAEFAAKTPKAATPAKATKLAKPKRSTPLPAKAPKGLVPTEMVEPVPEDQALVAVDMPEKEV